MFQCILRLKMKNLIWKSWFVCVLLSVQPAKAVSVEHVCKTCNSEKFCDCSSMGLETVPFVSLKDVLGLNLSHNLIKVIEEDDFKLYTKLKELMLQSNQIASIHEDAFSFFADLEYLDLSNNCLLQLIPSWFSSLSSLQHLNILGNKYTTLGKGRLFAKMSSLRYLKCGNPALSSIRQQDFAGIEELDELEFIASGLKHYQEGSFKSIAKVNHFTLDLGHTHPSENGFVFKVLKDLVNSTGYLELKNVKFNNGTDMRQLRIIAHSTVTKLSFRNIYLTDESVGILIEYLCKSEVKVLEFQNCELLGHGVWKFNETLTTALLDTVILKDIRIHSYYVFHSLGFLKKFLPTVKSVTCSDSQVFLVPCAFCSHFSSLRYFDLSGNLLTDHAMEEFNCNGLVDKVWPSLQTLNLSKNSMRSLAKISRLLSVLTNLTHLDISQNGFGEIPESCTWPANLKSLNLSATRLSKLTKCIPQNLEVLDVSSNYLKNLDLCLSFLKAFYVTSNSLTHLPDAESFPNLTVLRIGENQLNTIHEEDFLSFKELQLLDASKNNYICSCEFLAFMNYHKGLSTILVNWPKDYKCDSPSFLRGLEVHNATRSLFDCHKTMSVVLLCMCVLIGVVSFVTFCYKYHGIWYLRMSWAWLKAKRKPKKIPNKLISYDAFVSYSERDSEWVENTLVPELEGSAPPIRLCLHQRDFVPGKWIIDNIVDSIEKSRKTIFVLSEHFVQSNWCKYELDFVHFRLFEGNDSAILILLEPIRKETIPKRFCKLRRMMNTKTYLEWPQDEGQQHLFWFKLKLAIKD
uniref:Toll-like receptor 2 n=1 Tax=Latimeria chalumnae TaxID=7897 RepID=H3AXD4_LATCH